MVGKWHLCPDDEMNLASTRRNWPTGRGFERWYGFLGAETNQWYPDLVYDNHPVDQPKSPEEGYHLTEDLTDKAIEFITRREGDRAGEAVLPLLRARRLPRAASRAEGVDRQVQGPVRHGLRGDARADPGPPEGDGHRPGGHRAAADQPDRHAGDAHRARRQAVPGARRHAAVGLALGRREGAVLPHGRGLRRVPRRTPTTRSGGCSASSRSSAGARTRSSSLVSDNGASGEGGPNGSVNEMKFANGIPDTIEANLPLLDELGGPKTYNHYPNGWAMAFNTPFKMWKRYEFNGGTSDPCIISWPAGMKARGEIRDQYHHAIDLVPTILDVLGVEPPGDDQGPRPERASTASACATASTTPTAPTTRRDAVLLDARLAGDLARRLEGRHQPPDDQRLEQLQRRRVGAVPHRRRPLRAAQPRRRAPGQGARAREPLVRRGRRQRRVPARRPLGARDHAHAAAGAVAAAQPLHLLPGHRRRARVAGGQRPQPLVHDRRAGRHPGRRRGGRAVRPRLAVRRPRPVRQGQPAALRLQLRRHVRAEGRRRPRTCRPART